MKKIWIVVLCVALAIAFAACSSQEQSQEPAGEQAAEKADEQVGEQAQTDHELAGEWRYTEEIIERMSSMGDDVAEAVKNTVVTFDKDGTVLIKNGTNETTGKYALSEGTIVLEQESEMMYLTLEGDILTVSGDPYFERH